MKLEIKNIGGISYSDIELGGITVIAGENNSGKSTVGKSIYSLVYGISTPFDEFKDNIYSVISEIFQRFLFYVDARAPLSPMHITPFLKKNLKIKIDGSEINYKTSISNLLLISTKELTESFIEYLSSNNVKRNSVKKSNIDLPAFPKELLLHELDNLKNITFESFIKDKILSSVDSEFNSQLVNFNTKENAHIKLLFDNGSKATFETKTKNGRVASFFSSSNFNFSSMISSPIYIDTPLILDYLQQQVNGMPFFTKRRFYSNKHSQNLVDLLISNESKISTVEKLFNEQSLGLVLKKLSSIYDGEIVHNENGLFVRSSRYGKNQLNVSNLSSGLKIFAILKQLILKGLLKRNGFLILDEPEIHVHPKWQIILAEISVLLNKYLGIQVIITSHSPYFIEAIDLYSKKYELNKQTRFYLSRVDEKGMFFFEDKTNDQSSIYSLLFEPFQTLEDEHADFE